MEILAIHGGTPVCNKVIGKKLALGKEEFCAVNKVLESGILSMAGRGYFVKEFENNFAHFHGVSYAITTTSGTSALHTAVAAIGITFGDEVLVPALTFVSSASVIVQQGGIPVFVDVNMCDYCINVDDLISKITEKTKAIVLVHLYGAPVNMKKVLLIAEKFNLRVIEDCAQAHGARYHEKLVGTFGDMACFSFYQTKNMTCGEGGMVITNDEDLYKVCRSLSDHGIINGNLYAYDYERLGYNYHMSELQASIGIEQLKKLDSMNIIRRKNANRYRELLNDTPISFQNDDLNNYHVYYSLTALLPERLINQRDWFVDAVRAENVEINKIYPVSLNKTKYYLKYCSENLCNNAENISARLFNFYTNPGVSTEYIEKTCDAVKKVLNYLLYEK